MTTPFSFWAIATPDVARKIERRGYSIRAGSGPPFADDLFGLELLCVPLEACGHG